MTGASQDDVTEAMDSVKSLGGAKVEGTSDVKLASEEPAPQGGAGDALSCSALLALVLAVAAMLA